MRARSVTALWPVILVCVCVGVGACDGKTTVPKVRLELSLQPAEVGELQELVQHFAGTEGFVIEDFSPELSSLPLGRKYVWLRLKRGRTMEVRVHDFEVPNVFTIAFYDLNSDPRFDETAGKLEAMLREKWPNRLVRLSYD